ncbi:hypothetical protein LJ739_08830 [Aestuariibacter halophilus]|uniref:KfrA N-terminal DNA-binding domain-containing protein n=1 Tax=Fluctibacter halophilus TaxID=226011 RepID=A0ABS8G6W4_9ALTE|nr:hypothetical protein [Aestuariibacter halophilus]MCC2616342.1 hypothetical protein [Aestuariibacter halophilus]
MEKGQIKTFIKTQLDISNPKTVTELVQTAINHFQIENPSFKNLSQTVRRNLQKLVKEGFAIHQKRQATLPSFYFSANEQVEITRDETNRCIELASCSEETRYLRDYITSLILRRQKADVEISTLTNFLLAKELATRTKELQNRLNQAKEKRDTITIELSLCEDLIESFAI